jgi:transcriptional regulator with XRE-family HTH domain
MSESVIGEALRRFRERGGMTQAQAQKALAEEGYVIDTTTLSKYESGTRAFPSAMIGAVARAYGLSPEEESSFLELFVDESVAQILDEYKRGGR